MIIKTKQSKTAILNEGSYPVKLTSIKGLPDNNNPKKVSFGFTANAQETEIFKELPYSLEEGTPLRNDTETLLGHKLTVAEAVAGVDLNTLLNTDCQVVVAHKSGAGGKPKAVVSVILAASPAAK